MMASALHKNVVEMKHKRQHAKKYNGSDHPRFTVEELKKFLDAARDMGRRELAMFLVGFSHGLRASEITSIKISDIDFKAGKMQTRRKKGSNDSRQKMQRWVGYDEEHVLQMWLKERASLPGAAESDVVFLSQKPNAKGERMLDRSQVYRIFTHLCQAAGLREELQHPHALRHSTGYILRDMGAGLEYIQQVLGHKSIASTGIYTQPNQDDVDKVVSSIAKKLR
jgi:type 1 fimbriae regulatory protein FimB